MGKLKTRKPENENDEKETLYLKVPNIDADR